MKKVNEMIFLDTSFIVSYYNIGDENHNKALKVMEDLKKGLYGDVVISDYIFDESATIIYYKLKDLNKTIRICEILKKLIEYDVDRIIFEESWNIFANQKNSKFSFTDCSILALMAKNKIINLATFDKEFQKINWLKILC